MNKKMTLAQALIAENKRTKSKSLDLRYCGLTELPKELFECVWLEELYLGEFEMFNRPRVFDELSDKIQDIRIEYVEQEATNHISDISGIQYLYNLQSLNISENEIFDISQLESLQNLQSLFFSTNYVSDISALSNLSNLKYLYFNSNKVEDLSPLKDLKDLEVVAFSENGLEEFPYFLKDLPSLKDVYFLPNPYQIKGYQAFDLLLHSSLHISNALEVFIQIANAVEKQIKEQENFINLKIPKLFERIFSQYILLFKDFVKITKGKIIEFYLRSENDELLLVTNGKTNISRPEILRYLKEYVNLLTQNLKTQPINIENRDMNNQRLAIEYDAFILELQAEITGLNHKIDILKFKNKHLETEIKDKGQQLLYFQETLQLALGKSNDSFDFDKVTKEIIDKLARMQERKYTKKHEDLHNDDLTGFLRDKKYYITDQTRSGSGKAKKQAGELDIMIREINGTPVSIIEAMRLDSCGAKNTKILEHLRKLLFDYGGTGLERNFFIIYAEAKDFESLWTKYQIYINETVVDDDDFASFQRGGLSPILSLSKPEIKVGKTRYKRFGSDIEVYHLFVNMYVG